MLREVTCGSADTDSGSRQALRGTWQAASARSCASAVMTVDTMWRGRIAAALLLAAALLALVPRAALAALDTPAARPWMPQPSQPQAPPNILYLMADDMRPQLGAYGHSWMSTPNIDALAESGTLFEQAYTQFAYCAPSRNSFLTGRRPERTRCLNFMTDFRKQHGDAWTSLPQWFKNHGYFTSAAGKLYHDGMDDPLSWSYPSNQTEWIQCQKDDLYMNVSNSNYCGVWAGSSKDIVDEDLILTEGLKRMDLAAASGKPWFVGIGTHRPHWASRLPKGWYGPQAYPAGGPGPDPVKPPAFPSAISDAPWMSGNWFGGDYKDPAHGCPNCTVPPSRANEYRRWYYAAVSYADHMLGQALAKLNAMGPDVVANTIVVMHSDHGYFLGELNEWSKKTTDTLATHVPLIIRVPWKTTSIGARSAVRAELVDLYKTLAELTGLDDGLQPDIQGVSLAPVFDDPAHPPAALASKPAFSQIGSCACKNYTRNGWTGPECDAGRCFMTPVDKFDYMGYTMLLPPNATTGTTFRFTAWVHMDPETNRTDWSKPVTYGLYDEGLDSGRQNFDDAGMASNLAGDPRYGDWIVALHDQLKAAVLSWY